MNPLDNKAFRKEDEIISNKTVSLHEHAKPNTRDCLPAAGGGEEVRPEGEYLHGLRVVVGCHRTGYVAT